MEPKMKFLFIFFSLFISCHAQGETFEPTKDRTIILKGSIDNSVYLPAARIVALALYNHEPIDILIDSYGGDVTAGYNFIKAIEFAKKTGADVRCVNVGNAMSMAFMIIMHCSDRYALPGSKSMFHFARPYVRNYLTYEQAEEILERIKNMQQAFLDDLFGHLKRPMPLIRQYCEEETIWSPDELNKFSPGFYTVVDGLQGVDLSTLF
jgi:ATP-dependent protease ClpP protease subunit